MRTYACDFLLTAICGFGVTWQHDQNEVMGSVTVQIFYVVFSFQMCLTSFTEWLQIEIVSSPFIFTHTHHNYYTFQFILVNVDQWAAAIGNKIQLYDSF